MTLQRRITGMLRNDSGRLVVAIFVAAAMLAPASLYTHPGFLGVLALLPLAYLLRRHPRWAAGCIAAAGFILRFGWLDRHSGDQIMVAQQATERVLAGLSPYGVWFNSFPPYEAPYPYGPWAWLWWQPGVAVELAATAAILGVLIWRRAWIMTAIFACWAPAIALNTVGVNDYSPALFLVLALALAESHPRVSALMLAFASGLKLQALAWAPALFFYLPTRARWLLVAAVALVWSPLLVWGVGSLLESIWMVEQIHDWDNGLALNMPWLRLAVIPALLLAVRARTVLGVALNGAAIFALLMFTGSWGSVPHWFPIILTIGLAVEMRTQSTLSGLPVLPPRSSRPASAT